MGRLRLRPAADARRHRAGAPAGAGRGRGLPAAAARGAGRSRALPVRAALVPAADGAGPVARRVLLPRVRRDRGAAAVLGRPRRAGRRPPQGGERPRRAARRHRPLLRRGLLPAVARGERAAAGGLPGAEPRGAADGARDGGRRRADPRLDRRPGHHRARAGVAGRGRAGQPVPARREPARQHARGACRHRPPLRRQHRASPAAGDPARGRRRPRPGRARARAGRVPHERGPRRLPAAGARRAARRRCRPDAVRGLRAGARGHHLHDAHARAGGHRPVPARADRALLRPGRPAHRPRGRADHAPRRRAGGRRRGLQHGDPRPAQRAAGQRRVAAARPGVAQHVPQPLAGLRDRRGPDRPHHQRRALPDVGEPRLRGALRAHAGAGLRATGRVLGAARRRLRRGPVERPSPGAAPAGRRDPRAPARGVAGPRREPPPARLDRWRLRSRGADHRLRPARAVVQAPDADPARPRAPRAAC